MPPRKMPQATPQNKGRGGFIDLTGKRVGDLVVLEQAGREPNTNQILWRVRYNRSGIETTYSGMELRKQTADFRDPLDRPYGKLPDRLKRAVDDYQRHAQPIQETQHMATQNVRQSILGDRNPIPAPAPAPAATQTTPETEPGQETGILGLITDYLQSIQGQGNDLMNLLQDADSIEQIRANFPKLSEQLTQLEADAIATKGMIDKVMLAIKIL